MSDDRPADATALPAAVRCSLKAYLATHTGRVRERNEDSHLMLDLASGARFAVGEPHQLAVGDGGVLLAVFDGMGGAASGDVASRMAAEVVARCLFPGDAPGTAAPSTGSVSGSAAAMADRLYHAVREANLAIRAAARKDRDCHGMGTTVTAAVVLPSVARLLLMQVGDSRAYLQRQGRLSRVTEDQSLCNELLAQGELDSEEVARFEFGNVILQALGVNAEVEPTFAEVALCQGDRLLLCSDGLTDMVGDDDLWRVMREAGDDLGANATALIDRANDQGGHDNVTVLLAAIEGEGLAAVGERPPPVTVTPLRVPAMEAILRRRGILRQLTMVGSALLLMLVIAAMIVLFGKTS